jgi:hypothetical protein
MHTTIHQCYAYIHARLLHVCIYYNYTQILSNLCCSSLASLLRFLPCFSTPQEKQGKKTKKWTHAGDLGEGKKYKKVATRSRSCVGVLTLTQALREIRWQNIFDPAQRIRVIQKTLLIQIGLVIVGLLAERTQLFPFTGCGAFHLRVSE